MKNGLQTLNKTTAQALLDTLDNDHNREIDQRKINKYIKLMLTNEWVHDYNPIKIANENGKLLLMDGQHRLRAIIESNTEQEVYIILDVPTFTKSGESMFRYIDPSNRKVFETLAITNRAVRHPKEVTLLVGQLTSFNAQTFSRENGTKTTHNNIDQLADAHRPLTTLDQFVDRGIALGERHHQKGIRLGTKLGAFLASTIDTCEGGKEFLQDLVTYSFADLDNTVVINGKGQEPDPFHPITNLFANLYKMENSNKKGANAFMTRVRLVFKAYDQYMKEEAVSSTGYKYSSDVLVYPLEYEGYSANI